MLNQEQSLLFYNQIISITLDKSKQPREKYLNLYNTYKNILLNATEEFNQLFSSNYSRLVFIIDRYNISSKFSFDLKRTHNILSLIRKKKDKSYNNDYFDFAVKSLSNFLKIISNSDIPEKLDSYISKINIENVIFDNIDLVFKEFLKGIFIKKILPEKSNSFSKLVIDSLDSGIVTIILNEYWEEISKYIWKNCSLNFFNLKKLKRIKDTYELSGSSIIVLEPDYLIDVTDIAENFHNSGSNPYLFFLKKFIQSDVSASLILGNIVNFCLDELITNPESDFEEIYKKALKYKPLQIFAFYKNKKSDFNSIKNKVKVHFEVLKTFVGGLQQEICSVEPSFLSPKFGLQGRLDLLLEYKNEKNRKDIVELKSGNSPKSDYSLKTNTGQIVKTGIWNNHFAQTTCYNLLLDSAIENRTGSSSILYTSATELPLRNAPNIIQKKQEVIKLRNLIVALERAIALGQFSLLDSIDESKIKDTAAYAIEDSVLFRNAYKNSSELERLYFQSFLKFIINEIYYEKFCSENNNGKLGFSSLWKDSIFEKVEAMNILAHLKLSPEESNLSSYHLTFTRDKNNIYASSLRKGDIGILYQMNDFENHITNSQILKCYIKEISPEKVVVSLRNKQINPELLDESKDWAIEPDYIDATNKILIKSIYRFLTSDKENKELLLGLKSSKDLKQINYYSHLLTDLQNDIITNAINAEKYFLIQGPPGTGKTSYILKALVEYYLNHTYDNILILAYTNRAVDEISDSISGINKGDFFLRLGSKEATDKKDTLIAHLAEIMPLATLYKRLNTTRVLISTVSSLLMNPEMFAIKKFNIAIIDEASQILEPQLLGILTQVEKFIMIGDEKQLPAVVVQPERNLIVNNNLFNEIHLKNLGSSLFERLLNVCMTNHWVHSFGMLNQQARMHKSIQQLTNGLFYSGRLIHFNNDWQNSNEISIYKENINLFEFLENERIIFIESELEDNFKVHNQEARRVALLIDAIMKSYKNVIDNKTVGVITPFRAQCSRIYEEMNPNYRSLVNVDTVERFQGSEREIIIISFAINHKFLLKNIQSLTSTDGIYIDRKLNVALTRAKQQLIILGVREILISSPVFSDMFKYINVIGRIIKKESASRILKN